MAKTYGKAIRQKALSELERLAMSLDDAFDITANLSIAEIDEELRAMGLDPHHLSSRGSTRILSGRGGLTRSVYAFVSDALLRSESATSEVKLLILQIRTLCRRLRYGEASELAEQVTRLAPDYWRGWLNHGSFLCLLGDVDGGGAIFHRMRRDFSANRKAAAAALHGCATAKEDGAGPNPPEGDLRQASLWYEESLELDDSRANTRACLVITSTLLGQTDKGERLFEDSLLCEGFFDAMSFELAERGARDGGEKMDCVLRTLPAWFRNLLDDDGAGRYFGAGTTAYVH